MTEIEGFLSYLKVNRNRSEATVKAYRPLLLRLEGFLQGRGKGVLEATAQDLEVFSGPHLHKEGLDAASRAKAVSSVRGFYRWASRLGLVRDNPAVALDRPKLPDSLPTMLSLEQAEKLIWAPDLATMRGVRDAALMAFLIGTGCRVSGLVALNEEDLWAEMIDGKRWHFALLKEKGKKQRKVALPKMAVIPMLMWLGHEERKALDETRYHLRTGATRVVFCSTKRGMAQEHEWNGEGRRMTHKAVREVFQRHGKRVGIPPKVLHPHAARHLMATHLFDEAVEHEVRKAQLGHERDETLAIYTRMSRKRLLVVAGDANPLSSIRTPFDELADLV